MKISLDNLEFFAHHGVLPQEQAVGQEYVVDVGLNLVDSSALSALIHDELSGTVNYAEAYVVVRREMAVPSALLEHVAARTAGALLQAFPTVQSVNVKITKLRPPVSGMTGSAAVEIRVPRRLVVLDFDGTMADTAQGIVKTMHTAFAECGCPQPTDADIRATIGLPLVQSIAQLAGIGGERLTRAVDSYRRNFEVVGAKAVTLFPHVAETLQHLSRLGATLAIATSRGHQSADELCQALGVRHLITHIVACEDVAQAKPEPEAVLKLMQLTGVQPSHTFVVGDTSFDILMGARAGATTIGVTYGNHTPQVLREAGANHLVDGFEGVLQIVMND